MSIQTKLDDIITIRFTLLIVELSYQVYSRSLSYLIESLQVLYLQRQYLLEAIRNTIIVSLKAEILYDPDHNSANTILQV